MMTASEFSARHGCPDEFVWDSAECGYMQEAWDTAQPEWLIWIATRPGVLDDQTLRRFAVWSARRVRHTVEALAGADVGDAWKTAWCAASVASETAWSKWRTWQCSAAAWDGEREAQAAWLRANAKPNFDFPA